MARIDLTKGAYKDGFVMDHLKRDRLIRFRYDLLDKNEKTIGSLSVAEGSIDFNSECDICCTASFNIKESEMRDINVAEERLQPYFEINVGNEWLSYVLGTYIISTPDRRENDGSVYRAVEAYDKTIILSQDKAEERVVLTSGQYYIEEAIKILLRSGVNKHKIIKTSHRLSCDIEFEPGTSYLEIINSLLKAVNYEPLHFDHMGYACSSVYKSPFECPVDHIYQTNNDSLILTGSNQFMDMFDTPNVFIRYLETPDQAELISKYVNDKSSSPISTISRGRRIVDIESVDDIADQTTLDDFVRRVAIEKSQITDTVFFKSGLMPNHGYRDIIYFDHSTLGTSAKFVETGWNMELKSGGAMTHTLKRAVMML